MLYHDRIQEFVDNRQLCLAMVLIFVCQLGFAFGQPAKTLNSATWQVSNDADTAMLAQSEHCMQMQMPVNHSRDSLNAPDNRASESKDMGCGLNCKCYMGACSFLLVTTLPDTDSYFSQSVSSAVSTLYPSVSLQTLLRPPISAL